MQRTMTQRQPLTQSGVTMPLQGPGAFQFPASQPPPGFPWNNNSNSQQMHSTSFQQVWPPQTQSFSQNLQVPSPYNFNPYQLPAVDYHTSTQPNPYMEPKASSQVPALTYDKTEGQQSKRWGSSTQPKPSNARKPRAAEATITRAKGRGAVAIERKPQQPKTTRGKAATRRGRGAGRAGQRKGRTTRIADISPEGSLVAASESAEVTENIEPEEEAFSSPDNTGSVYNGQQGSKWNSDPKILQNQQSTGQFNRICDMIQRVESKMDNYFSNNSGAAHGRSMEIETYEVHEIALQTGTSLLGEANVEHIDSSPISSSSAVHSEVQEEVTRTEETDDASDSTSHYSSLPDDDYSREMQSLDDF